MKIKTGQPAKSFSTEDIAGNIVTLNDYEGRQQAPFPIIADPQRQLYRLYGVESSWSGFLKGSLRIPSVTSALMKGFWPGKMEGLKSMVPADFLIGPDLTVEVAYYGNDIGDHLPVEKINLWLDSSQLSE